MGSTAVEMRWCLAPFVSCLAVLCCLELSVRVASEGLVCDVKAWCSGRVRIELGSCFVCPWLQFYASSCCLASIPCVVVFLGLSPVRPDRVTYLRTRSWNQDTKRRVEDDEKVFPLIPYRYGAGTRGVEYIDGDGVWCVERRERIISPCGL